jgi:hypothetical protein
MELQAAIAAYREQIRHVFSQMEPPQTEEWIAETTDRLMAPFEARLEEGAGSTGISTAA